MPEARPLDEALSAEWLARARRLTPATLHEAFARKGALPAALKPIAPAMRMAGRALPVRCPAGDNLWIHHALSAAAADDVLVVDVGPGTGYGYWGEIMATAALARGLAGLVISGGVRDSQRLIEMGLPTFARGLSILGTGKNPQGDGSVGDPVRLGDVVIRRGDLIVGDADGLVGIPAREAAAIIEASERRDEAEVAIMEKLRAGATTLDVYKF